ncbi:putative bifunctional diguanylate cyclase/phosphodiesterase [Zhongshania aquimaris]|uniref:EAL domain-containing protein n=1 Tax=Zhongshania aquimaris TaxID=2857107 RepID=A0ABS6VQQ2_9GAMM|nr:EAL domain-containing protein [Zhongshania aquimaris]
MLFLAVTLVMGGRGYLSFVQTVNSQREKVELDLSQLEATFHAIHQRSSNELFRLADQLRVPAENELDDGEAFAPSLISGIESIYYLSNTGTILNSSKQAGSNEYLSEKQISDAVDILRREQRPHANLSCLLQCFQSVFIPVIADDGRELIININRSATLLIQDFYEITGADIALFSVGKESDVLAVDKVFVASNAEIISSVLVGILKSRKYSSHGNHIFFDSILNGLYSARFFPLSSDGDIISYAAVLQDQSHIRALIIQALKDIVFSTVITLVLVVLLIALILKPSLNRVMRLAEVLPLLPKGRFSDAKKLNKANAKKKFSDEIDVLQYTVNEVVDSLEDMSASVSQHRDELRLKIEALTEAKLFNELILDSSPLVVVIHDRDGVIYNINKLGRELAGLSSSSPVAANINNWVKNEHSSKSLSSALANIFDSTSKKMQGEMAFFTDSGHKLYFLWTHSCLQINGESRILSMGVDITERKETAQSLYWLGQHDRITGLLNRGSFTESASEAIAKYHDSHHIELVMFDIDDFAIFNDRFGFDAGDCLLNSLAAYLMQVLPDHCLLARTGSGEFCAIIQHAKSTGQSVKDLSLESLARYIFIHNDIHEEICISIVVDCYDESLSGIDELISNSTSTMAKVKSKIKGSLYYAAESGDSSKQQRQMKYRMREQLQSALADNRLVVFYQPILDLASNSISHCECLVRMLDSEGEFISPAHFLGIAAESGLMPQLDFSVMEKAMRQQRIWEDSGIHVGLSINITAFTLEQADFEARLVDMISRTGANPARLIFEVVETDALENLSVARKLLNNFKNVGAKVALDDFGIGFTSFEYVRELPVDYIKIDQSFIRFIHERESDQILVRSMVEMSHNLGKKVIVEGVEHREAFDIVREIGVECVQGYYVCRPVPISALDLSLSIKGA